MRHRRINVGERLLAVGIVSIAIYAGAFRLITGHFPGNLTYWVIGWIALSIMSEAYFNLLEAIEESTEDIKAELEKLREETQKANERSETLDSRLAELRIDVEEFIEESKMKDS